MTYTGQAEGWTEGSLSANTENWVSNRTEISMSWDLHRSSKTLDGYHDDRRDGDPDGP